MEFVGLTLVLLVVGFFILAALARAFQGHSVADLLDWKPTRSPEVEAQNEMRRRRGAQEITEADVQRQAAEDQRNRLRGRGPFSQGGGLDDDED